MATESQVREIPAPDADEFVLSGDSPEVQSLLRLIETVAKSDLPVLVIGERGTRTVTVARLIHLESPHASGPMSVIDCATAGPDFPGAVLSGTPTATLILREVSALAASRQIELVEWLRTHKGPPRVIACTESNLDDDVRSGHLRDDLVQLVGAFTVRVPSLRHRRSDIPLLVDRLVSRYAALLGKDTPSLGPTLVNVLQQLTWPGNLDQLEAAAKMISLLDDEHVAVAAVRSTHAETLERSKRAGAASLKDAARAASRAAERELITKVLAQSSGNRKAAARQLKISYKALLYKLKQLGIASTVQRGAL